MPHWYFLPSECNLFKKVICVTSEEQNSKASMRKILRIDHEVRYNKPGSQSKSTLHYAHYDNARLV